MPSPTTTGSFWRCPSCTKHVPSRQDACRCGFDRTKSAAITSEVQVVPTPEVEGDRSRGVGQLAGRTAIAVVLLACCYWAYRAWSSPPTSPANSELARRIRAARERWESGPQVAPALTEPAADLIGSRTWNLPPPPPPAEPVITSEGFGDLAENDRATAQSLAAQLSSRTVPTARDVSAAEALLTRYPQDSMVRLLFRSLLIAATEPLQAQRLLPEARQMLERGRSLLPGDLHLTRITMALAFDMADWPAAVALASEVLTEDGTDPNARTVFALATAAQGNDRDALTAIYSALEIVRSGPQEATLRNLRDQLERRMWAISGCDESQLPDPARGGEATERLERFLAMVAGCTGGGPGQRLAHFSVGFRRLGNDVVFEKFRIRFASVDTIGRDMLLFLEPQYSAVALGLDHEMRRPIPVVVFQDVEYRMVTGAPLWAGGQFDNEDGTISLPITILDRLEFLDARGDPDPEVQREWQRIKDFWRERILIHETAHAFIEDMSGGIAPRDLHEGLAQIFERDISRERTPLSSRILQAAREEAVAQYPDSREAQARYVAGKLEPRFNEIRTTGSRHSGTVRSVYIGAEMFADYLIGQRSMGGVRDLLRSMASTQNADAAYQAVYGRSYDGVRRAWLDALRGEWGVGEVRH